MPERFPSIEGKNLNKQAITVPDDFSEQPIVLIVAFQRWHQRLVDESIELLEQHNMNDTHSILEIPVIQRATAFRRMRLDALMRAGIPDLRIRQRTITVYLDKKAFMDDAGIPSDGTIYWFLIDHATKETLLRGTGVIGLEAMLQIKAATP
ncbi:hypothetical protein N9A87_04175 [Euryarchaeota archaeon]|nr:hypothetical protein [Euryarchaeota archaeon]